MVERRNGKVMKMRLFGARHAYCNYDERDPSQVRVFQFAGEEFSTLPLIFLPNDLCNAPTNFQSSPKGDCQ